MKGGRSSATTPGAVQGSGGSARPACGGDTAGGVCAPQLCVYHQTALEGCDELLHKGARPLRLILILTVHCADMNWTADTAVPAQTPQGRGI